LLKAWHKDDDNDFYFVNSHDKAAAVRDGSRKETLHRVLSGRLRNSKNMVLILGNVRLDNDYFVRIDWSRCPSPFQPK
jgi:hypothetical protein